MKRKISLTMDRSLLEFLDSLPGESRSEKIERAVRRLKEAIEEMELRMQLGGCCEGDEERVEREIWERTVSEAMWTE